VNEQGFRG